MGALILKKPDQYFKIVGYAKYLISRIQNLGLVGIQKNKSKWEIYQDTNTMLYYFFALIKLVDVRLEST